MSDIDPNKAVDFMLKHAKEFAAAKAERVYLEEFRKTKKALLMGECEEKTSVAQERFAYAHDEYAQLLSGLRAAVENEERLKWELIAAQTRVEVWRTQQANDRAETRAVR